MKSEMPSARMLEWDFMASSAAERDPEMVLEDVSNASVTAEAARDVYRVAIDKDSLTIDAAATRRLRSPD